MGYRVTREGLEELNTICENKIISPVIDTLFSLEETPAAFRYFENGMFQGKIVIKIDAG